MNSSRIILYRKKKNLRIYSTIILSAGDNLFYKLYSMIRFLFSEGSSSPVSWQWARSIYGGGRLRPRSANTGRDLQPGNRLLDPTEAQVRSHHSWAGCSPPPGSNVVFVEPWSISSTSVVAASEGSVGDIWVDTSASGVRSWGGRGSTPSRCRNIVLAGDSVPSVLGVVDPGEAAGLRRWSVRWSKIPLEWTECW